MLRPATKLITRTGSDLCKNLQHGFQAIGSALLHLTTIVLLCVCILFVNWMFGTTGDQSHLRPLETYGYIGCVLLYCLRCIPYLYIPFGLTNILGIVTMNTYPSRPVLKVPIAKIPFMCFRVVTRGLYPALVKKNVERNIQTCYKVGLDTFTFEVVTDNPLHLHKSPKIRELVVPSGYVTNNNSMFKARALQYCNEPEMNVLSSDDWVVHLDEETLLTEASTIGLANFASENHGDVGQGVISYANEEIVNWWTTLADSVRVTVDMSMLRFSFKTLGCPLMGFKGSYIIAKESVEKNVGFDFGPKGSVAEDLMFALVAWKRGYNFNFVEGEMWEKSPFTVGDYVKQRKRWFIGHLFVLLRSDIPLKCKIGILPTDLGWLLMIGNILNIPVLFVFPIPLPLALNVIAGSMGGLGVFMFIFGSIKSFSLRKYGIFRKMLIVIGTIPIIPLVMCLYAVASLHGVYTRNSLGFHIVKKETTPSLPQSHESAPDLNLNEYTV